MANSAVARSLVSSKLTISSIFPPEYRDDTISLLGRFVDHNDRVEEGALSTAYDVTVRAWKVQITLLMRLRFFYSLVGF